MKRFLIAYLAAGGAMLLLDTLWLGTMAKRLYRPLLGDLLRPGFALMPALCFYVIYLAGIVLLAIGPALAEGRLSGAAWRGAVLGFVAYATYDLTNQATLRNWPTTITLADLAWGTFLTCMAATAGYWAAARLG